MRIFEDELLQYEDFEDCDISCCESIDFDTMNNSVYIFCSYIPSSIFLLYHIVDLHPYMFLCDYISYIIYREAG